jgi:PilZ domain
MNEPFPSFEDKVDADTKRGNGRDSLLLKAILRFPTSAEEGEVRIRNLSAGGLMAEAPVRVARGEKVEVNLRNIGWISGSVVWVTEGRLGIAFDHPINPAEARKPAKASEHDVPHYLQKLNAKAAQPKNLRRV